ncbi:MAG: DUF1016 family protein [Rhodococcus sp. (in: high G+C Gram-positive bacteria)]|nr:MAG: DUF1016 family protein [Rhodococcus sp. (in: high G+C Gram-positive bacteria)]
MRKLNFYVNAVDELLRKPEHRGGTTIGILLALDRDDIVVEYALRGLDSSLAVSTHTTHRSLRADVRPALLQRPTSPTPSGRFDTHHTPHRTPGPSTDS